MSNLRYGLEYNRIHNYPFVDIPKGLFERTVNASGSFARTLGQLASRSYISIETDNEQTRLIVNTNKIGQRSESRSSILKTIVGSITEVTSSATETEEDENLKVIMGGRHQGSSNNLSMWARVKWPEQSNEELIELVDHHMRLTAKDLAYPAPSGLVFSTIRRDLGVTLETNPMKNSSLTTSLETYSEESEFFVLSAQNIYKHDQQLICLVGVIAIAHPDEIK